MDDIDYTELFDSIPDEYEFIYDDYGELVETENADVYGQYGGLSSYTIYDLWNNCLFLTLIDGSRAVLRLLLCCIVFKIVASFKLAPPSIIHFSSFTSGIICLYLFFGLDIGYIVALAIIGLTTLIVTPSVFGQKRGLVCSLMCVLYLTVCELCIVERARWHKIRGAQMILTMKIISLAFDVDEKPNSHPTLLQCLGYLFCSGTVIFGPWVPFSDYAILIHRPMSIIWVLKVVQNYLVALAFLSISTCWAEWILPFETWIWIAAYKDALSFRCSHYFISFLSEATALSVGISSASHTWSAKVVSPVQIEFPRSLVEVVIYWNIPMHSWLKTYVFKTARPYGKFVAIFFTFAASSLLHGLNFQLAAVLLSLGVYTYVESAFRMQLADIYNACILARKCKKDCSHQFKSDNVYVRLTNIGFGLLTVFHLAYLGVMFNTSQLEEEGYSMEHTLDTWRKLSFASHWIVLTMHLMCLLLS